ncbi:family S53 protease [Amylocystis lapponica]|nr:family S53 protease [Amylocystis lapponica]
MFSRVLMSSLFFALALSKPLARTMRVHERRESAPSGFTLNGPASPDTVLTLRIALVQSNPQGLEDALYAVSTPSSPQYGQYLTKEEAAQYVAPAAASVEAVHSWLAENGLNATTMTPAGDWLSVKMPVSQANELFATDFQVYTHTTGKQAIRTLEYSIPAGLSGHLDLVHPTTTFPVPSLIKPHVRAAQNFTVTPQASSCGTTITPACLLSLYGIPKTAATESSNVLAVTEYEEQYVLKSDLKSFLKKYRTDISSTTSFTTTTLDGGSNPQQSGEGSGEGDLDIQYTVGLATGVPIQLIMVGDNTNDGDLDGWLDTINYLLNENSPPQTVTTSYGGNEGDFSNSLMKNYCNAAAQLGARGVSILFSSGDGGVTGGQNQDCDTFQPVFPASCPYITSVGATNGISPETAAYFSSGGFSNYFSAPSYQSSAVSSFLTNLGSTNDGLYNPSGRGFPDVSAQGVNFQIVQNGAVGGVDGTSCASPAFASVVSLINDRLLAAGKPALGFLNPWLYSTAAGALNDVTSGNNPGCGTDGFYAGSGWDPVTGLGTPNFNKLLSAAGL